MVIRTESDPSGFDVREILPPDEVKEEVVAAIGVPTAVAIALVDSGGALGAGSAEEPRTTISGSSMGADVTVMIGRK